MRKQNNLTRQINDRIEMYFLGEKQKRTEDAQEFYEYLVNGLKGWAKTWIEKEYEILGGDFIPEKISERARGIYDFMRDPIQHQIEKYQEDKN